MKVFLKDAGADKIIEILCTRGYQAYYVGGCVRDVLMGRTPHDFDIATNALPDVTASILREYGYAVIETGLKHGTVTAIYRGRPYEITTFRTDGKYLDHRRPSDVSYVKDIKEDMARRDFTINAMAIDKEGVLVDYFGGAEDIERRVIRCVGDPAVRFEEDALRIMRAIRFSAVLGFTIDENTSKAIHACRELFKNISAERICAEFSQIMVSERPSVCIREYIDVFGVFIPELLKSVGFDQKTPWHIYDVFEHTMTALDNTPPELTTRLAVLFHDIGKPYVYTEDAAGVGHFRGHAMYGADMAGNILLRLRFSRKIHDDVRLLVRHHDDRIPAERASVKRLMRRLGAENAARMADVELADHIAHNPVMVEARIKDTLLIRKMIDELTAEQACISLADLAVGGRDIIDAGVPQGKAVGDMLALLLEMVIDDKLPNEREALIKFVKENILI